MIARFTALPPFPEDVPTHPLLVIDYELIKKRGQAEIDKLWKAATELGFWQYVGPTLHEDVNEMFEMGAKMMRLPLDEEMKCEQGDAGISFGYKAAETNATDKTGALDTVEFINVSKDDALAWPGKKSLAVNNTPLAVLNDKLGLPEGALARRNPREEPSGSESRCIKNPPRPNGISEEQAAIGAHTDFGSLVCRAVFVNSGLQVMVPGTEQWQYIWRIPGHAICNVGDALTIFSGGILRSNLHRVV
uniref:Protein kinase domain-containing protein n=1 Tax=Ganoderma boninense TaxID=34458 RepID=A0A5K1K3S6_9APHY|nr:Protein kinase domain-containing protein [Ganoderma boninense]